MVNKRLLPRDDSARVIPPDGQVPTSTTKNREQWFLEALYRLGDPVLACGSSGVSEAWLEQHRKDSKEFDMRLAQWYPYRLAEIREHVGELAMGKIEVSSSEKQARVNAAWKYFLMMQAQHPEVLPGMIKDDGGKLTINSSGEIKLLVQYKDKPLCLQ